MYTQSLKKFMLYFGQNRRGELGLFFVMSLFAGFLEFFGIALIYPFVMVILNPSSIETLPLYNIQCINSYFNSHSPMFVAFSLGFLAMILFIIKNVYMILFLYIQSHFLQKWTQSINNQFMRFYLFAPYQKMLKIPTADKLYAVSTGSSQATNGFLMRIITIITNVSIVSLVLLLILYKFPLPGIVSLLFIIASVLLQNRFFKSRADEVNREIAESTRIMNGITFSNINSIKEVKIFGCEDRFYNTYNNHGDKLSRQNAAYIFFSGISPYLVETLIVVTLILLGAVIAYQNPDKNSVLVASFAMIVASVFRIAPALNRIQSCILNLPAAKNFIEDLIRFYEDFGMENFEYKYKKFEDTEKIPLRKNLILKNISFSYNGIHPVLKNISLEVNKGDFIGIIGLSGTGKSTLADVMTGLLLPDTGEIIVDGIKLNSDNFPAFRKNIGYVPQEIIVLDANFRENIAWAVPPDKIDDNRIEKLLCEVQLSDLVKKYDKGIYSVPFAGENGLSHGQKQRLAIARALYSDPEILLFDEATSALDVKTEHEIMSMLTNLCEDKTIIAVAHRLSGLQSCTRLVYMKDGHIADTGSFEELSLKYPDFAELLRLSTIEK